MKLRILHLTEVVKRTVKQGTKKWPRSYEVTEENVTERLQYFDEGEWRDVETVHERVEIDQTDPPQEYRL